MQRKISALLIVSTLLLVCTVFEAYLVYSTWTFRNSCVHVEGLVYDDRVTAPNTHYPSFVFAYKGDSIRIESTTGTEPPEYQIGDRVSMLVPPDSPRDARVDSFTELWLAPMIFGVFNLVLLIISLIVRRAQAKDQEAAQAYVFQGRGLGTSMNTGPGMNSGLYTGGSTLGPNLRSTPLQSDEQFQKQRHDFRQRFAKARELNDNVMLKVTLFFLGIGLLLLCIGLFLANREYDFSTHNEKRVARIVEYSRSRRYIYPLYEMRTAEGDTVRAYGRIGSTTADHELGAQVEVFFDPQDNSIREADFFSMYFPALICGGIGLAFMAFGGGFRILLKRDREQNQELA